MKINSINNVIICYLDYIQKLFRKPDNYELQKSLETLKHYYQLYKEDQKILKEIKNNSQQLVNNKKTDIQFSFNEIEQAWAYLHLMIESCEEKTLKLWNTNNKLSEMNAFQEGLSKLWSSSENKTFISVFL
ncbi:MAG: hypothetical protein J5710_06195 [Treponema sp.]|nr:hypothetical protein [Treponema sp.]